MLIDHDPYVAERNLSMIPKTREDLLTAMHSEGFGYARHMLFAKLARANGHLELADLLEEIADTDYLQAFAEEARLVGLVGTDVENLEAVKTEAHAPDRRSAVRAVLAKLRTETPSDEADNCACACTGLPEADQDDVC
jgi:rubrerythrin